MNMDETNQETQTPETEVEETTENQEVSQEEVEEQEAEKPEISKELKSALAQKDHFKGKFEKTDALNKELEAKLKDSNKNKDEKSTLGVDDYIDISASLEGLDKREKEYLAQQHKLSGTPLKELRESEDYTLWQKAYRDKVAEEKKTLAPSGAQEDADRPKSIVSKLKDASMAETEKILIDAGLYKPVKPREDVIKMG